MVKSFIDDIKRQQARTKQINHSEDHLSDEIERERLQKLAEKAAIYDRLLEGARRRVIHADSDNESEAKKDEVYNETNTAIERDEDLSDSEEYGDWGLQVNSKEGYLVDFNKKSEQLEATRYSRRERVSQDEVNTKPKKQCLETPIEIIDEFGRTRMTTDPDDLQYSIEAKPSHPKGHEQPESLDGHYDAQWEIRKKGVGWFDFSKNEQKRQEQMRAIKEADRLLEQTRRKHS